MGSAPLIAIVDDDEAVRRALTRLLKSAGYVAGAFGLAETFLRSGRLPLSRAVILDLRMPGMTGLKMQRHLATAGHRIPVIILTAHGDQEARRQALEAGAIAFLRKPFDAEELLGAVESALRWQ